jgi:hypothetical protein
LFRRVIHDDINIAQVIEGTGDSLMAERGIADIATNQHATAAFRFDQISGLPCVGFLFQVDQRAIRALAGEMQRHRAPDTAVAAGDQCHLPEKLIGAAIFITYVLRLRRHPVFVARLLVLMLGREM